MRPAAAPAPRWLLLALGALLSLWPAARTWELTILHTNDVHSRLEQTSEDSTKCLNASQCVGGVARLYTKVQQIRREEPNVLLLDAGDQYQGTIWFTVYKGIEVAHFMNILRYDAMVRRRVAGLESQIQREGLENSLAARQRNTQEMSKCNSTQASVQRQWRRVSLGWMIVLN